MYRAALTLKHFKTLTSALSITEVPAGEEELYKQKKVSVKMRWISIVFIFLIKLLPKLVQSEAKQCCSRNTFSTNFILFFKCENANQL